jgi:hypothetical protein
MRAMWAVRHAIDRAEAAGATEADVDRVLARAAAENFPHNDESRPDGGSRALQRHEGEQEA